MGLIYRILDQFEKKIDFFKYVFIYTAYQLIDCTNK